MPRVSFFPSRAAFADQTALLVFVTIGLASHHRGFSGGGYARDYLPLGGAWAIAGLGVDLYRKRTWRALLKTWFVGIVVGVVVRSFFAAGGIGKQAAFSAVALCFSLLFALAARVLLSLATRPGGFEPPTHGLEGRRSVH
jgi:hypothetical protein